MFEDINWLYVFVIVFIILVIILFFYFTYKTTSNKLVSKEQLGIGTMSHPMGDLPRIYSQSDSSSKNQVATSSFYDHPTIMGLIARPTVLGDFATGPKDYQFYPIEVTTIPTIPIDYQFHPMGVAAKEIHLPPQM